MKSMPKIPGAGLMLALGLVVVACAGGAQPTATPGAPVAISEAVVTAKGEVVPVQFAHLAFETGGTVAQVFVKEGDAVKSGDKLAQLDTKDLELQVQNAQNGLDLAQATLTQTKRPASPEELASAQAAVDSAQAALDKLVKGSTPEDIAAAQSAYASALAALNRAQNGPSADDLAILKAGLDKAKAAVDQAQSAYDRIGGASNPFIGLTPQALQLQTATQDYQIALSNYNKGVNGDPETIAAAKSQVAAALATLTTTKKGATAEEIAQAQASVKQAQAAFDLKKQGARPEDIAVAEKHVEQAQTALDQANANLAKATLTAPINGSVTDVGVRVGETVQAGAPVVTVADLSQLEVQTTDLDEFGAARLQVGQPAKIRVNAFNDKELSGKVSEIANQSVILPSGDVSYVVTVMLDNQDPELRWGMTTKVEFQQQ